SLAGIAIFALVMAVRDRDKPGVSPGAARPVEDNRASEHVESSGDDHAGQGRDEADEHGADMGADDWARGGDEMSGDDWTGNDDWPPGPPGPPERPGPPGHDDFDRRFDEARKRFEERE